MKFVIWKMKLIFATVAMPFLTKITVKKSSGNQMDNYFVSEVVVLISHFLTSTPPPHPQHTVQSLLQPH